MNEDSVCGRVRNIIAITRVPPQEVTTAVASVAPSSAGLNASRPSRDRPNA